MNTFLKAILASAVALSLPSIASAQRCPDFEVRGSNFDETAETAFTPQSRSMVAGGGLNLTRCRAVTGRGYITDNPDFTMHYDALGMGRALEFRVNAECDTVLLVSAAEREWYFNDYTDNFNPALRVWDAPSGRYHIFVGTMGTGNCGATLTVQTF